MIKQVLPILGTELLEKLEQKMWVEMMKEKMTWQVGDVRLPWTTVREGRAFALKHFYTISKFNR